jgi:uncharacterized protein (TIGR00725 family)
MSKRRTVVGVMGAGEGATAEAVALAEELGECISNRGWVLLTGGRPTGVMAAASRGAARVEGHLVVGVLPDEGNGDDRNDTAELDLALFTGMGKARNVINVLSAEVVVVCGGGGPGTASEAAHALNAGRPLILLAVPPLWRDFFCSLSEAVESGECERRGRVLPVDRGQAPKGMSQRPPRVPLAPREGWLSDGRQVLRLRPTRWGAQRPETGDHQRGAGR